MNSKYIHILGSHQRLANAEFNRHIRDGGGGNQISKPVVTYQITCNVDCSTR
jgi:hypothetical protein